MVWVYLLAFLVQAQEEKLIETVRLAPGQSYQLPINKTEVAHLSDGRSVDIQDLGSTLKITAKAPGTSQLNIGLNKYTIIVEAAAGRAVLDQFVKSIGEAKGLVIRRFGPHVVVEGQLNRVDDWRFIAAEAKRLGVSYDFKAKPQSFILSEAKAYYRETLTSSGLTYGLIDDERFPNLTLEPLAKNQLPKLQQALSPLGLSLSLSSKASKSNNIVLRVMFAAVVESESQKFGINWNNLDGMQLLPKVAWRDLTTRLSIGKDGSSSQLLSNSTMVTRIGQQVKFHSGGEIPYRVKDYLGASIEWKKHGLIVTATPKMGPADTIDLALDFETSSPAAQFNPDNAPPMKKKTFSANFDVPIGQTLLVTQLAEDDEGRTTFNAIDADVPIVSEAFKSRGSTHEKRHFVLFIQPDWATYDTRTSTDL